MDNLDEVAQRPGMYLSDTGVPGLASGLAFSLLGGSSLLQQALPREYKLIAAWVALGCVIVVLLGGWALKHRLVFPRGGYVQPQDRELGTRELIYMALTLAGIGVLFLILKAVTTETWSELSGTVFAICFAVMIAGAGRMMKRPKMYWFAAYVLCLGALLFWLRLPYTSISALQLGIGAPMAMIGAIRLRKFLKANPPIEQSGE